jgi:hypothetical protein
VVSNITRLMVALGSGWGIKLGGGRICFTAGLVELERIFMGALILKNTIQKIYVL